RRARGARAAGRGRRSRRRGQRHRGAGRRDAAEARRYGMVRVVGPGRHAGRAHALRRRPGQRAAAKRRARAAPADHARRIAALRGRRSGTMTDEQTPAPAERRRRKRVFFALWPDDPTRHAIERACRRAIRLSGGRPTAKRNLHITVAFLGDVDDEQLERAARVPPIEVGPIELELDVLGYFPVPRVLWLGPQTVPPALIELERALWEGLEREGFEREPRIYRPHLTL